MSDYAVAMIDIFEGPLHTKLRNIWRAFARWCDFPLYLIPNPGHVRPDVFLSEVWRKASRQAREDGKKYLVLTEHDVLPCPTRFPKLPHTEAYGAICAEHAQRDKERGLYGTVRPGQWYMAFDLEKVAGGVDFRAPKSEYHDPGNDLEGYLLVQYGVHTRLLCSNDDLHYGCTFLGGHHLFWSRHYNDDPASVVCGFKVGDILKAVNTHIELWLRDAPKKLLGHFRDVEREEGAK
jgi:hypothetical protein